MYPGNHKTVFVLDHTPYFGISTESPLEFECLKSRGQNHIPLRPICKSLWTTSVESSMEYCRIVWDLFPTGKLVNSPSFFPLKNQIKSHFTLMFTFFFSISRFDSLSVIEQLKF